MNYCLPDRLEAKIVRVPFSTCWYWIGATGSSGYGFIQIPKTRRNTGAHRAAYEAAIGPIPDGLDLDHLCRVRCCVNPAHLEPVTRKENLERAGIIKAINDLASARGSITHCKNGHPLSGDNLYTYPNGGGGRVCRACRRERDANIRKRSKP
jgi:hypothetical protein